MAILVALTWHIHADAADPAKYAQSSVLSTGYWVKIDITSKGLQTLSRQTLRNFGFSNPENVYVYGYGGCMIPEALSPTLPDDLPPVPVWRGNDGSISFYATDNIGLQAYTGYSSQQYSHTINPYGDTSYYFLSDVKPDKETPTIDLSDISDLSVYDTARQLLVHERDLIQAGTSGRDYLGEDFRSQKSQTFEFDLTDNTGDDATISVKFGANTSGAASSIMVSANGERLPATTSDRIAATTSSDQYYQIATSTKKATVSGNNLTVGIEYSQAGTVTTARLDWIEVEYTRRLTMHNGSLLFHVNAESPKGLRISGASESTIVWDVTDPADIKAVSGHYDADAETLTIGIRDTGFREFLVFEPGTNGVSVPGRFKISNQNIHGLTTPHMVIISPEEYTSAAERIADLHRTYDNMTVHVLTPEKIYNEFSSGNADLSAFRKLLKMWYDRSQADPEGNNFGYCLLMGRPTYDQKKKNSETIKAGYPRTLIWQSTGGLSETTSYCTDDFIGMLDDETSARSMWLRDINIGIGRYSVTSAEEANTIAEKLESYISAPDYGVWRNNVMSIADDGDNASHLNQAQEGIARMQSTDAGAHYAYDRIYLDAFELKKTGTGLEFPDAKEKMLKKWEKEGTAFISYIGHANPKEWGHEKLLTWEDITGMSCQHQPIVYAATCSFGKWDAESVSGAEVMVNNPAGGAIAMITPSRTVYISRNEYITNSISTEFFRRAEDGLGQRLGDVVRLGKNNCTPKDDNMNRYHMIGDPALRMPIPRYTVTIDSIAGRPLAEEQADSPTIEARSSVKISGRITDAEGNTVAFNGPVQFTLFDAEKSVTTNGWGDNGVKTVYDDRSSKLATGSVTARDGMWSTTILMPAEIANNYTPALITLYAYDSEAGEEANGSTEHIYVYGYNSTIAEDTEGPEIEKFVINSSAFADGDVVHANPVAIATFSDISGINISDAGIGHKMSLTLDTDKVYDDLSNYFTPDTEEEGRGSIAYPLPELDPGDHTLKLTVWDNANNSSSAYINFKVGINLKPELTEISTIYDRETDRLDLKITTDRSLCTLECKFECFALNGQKVWSIDRNAYSGKESCISYSWDLTDNNGNRLPRGIYILRTTVTAGDGMSQSENKKIAIPQK